MMAYSAVQIIISGFISLILGHVVMPAYLWVNDWIGNIPSLFGHAVKLCENYDLISPQNNLHLILFALVINTHSKRLKKDSLKHFQLLVSEIPSTLASSKIPCRTCIFG